MQNLAKPVDAYTFVVGEWVNVPSLGVNGVVQARWHSAFTGDTLYQVRTVDGWLVERKEAELAEAK